MGQTMRAAKDETWVGHSDLTVLTCPVCGVLYAIPENMRKHAHNHGGFKYMWHCPNGHEIGYGDDALDKAKAQAKRAEDRAAYERSRREQAEASARAQRGAATRARNQRDKIAGRVKNGVCPCCNRTLKDLQRHMASQHPEWKPEEE